MATFTESIGRVLAGRYRIESALGSGASAHVFAAWDVTLRRRVALKVLHPGLAADGTFLRRFRAEAQAAASLSHPNILGVYDWGEDDTVPFLVLEYLGGGSLRDLFDTGRRLSVSQAVLVGIQAADGLAFAHARGFVHRDIKPANLLFGDDARLRIADFGLARALAEAAYTEPVGATVGTARYAAPEQAQGRQVDGRADVYSLTLALYEAVTGVVPFTADTTLGTLMGRVGARLPGHDALGPLAGILTDAAAPEPEQRLDAARLASGLRALTARIPPPERIPLVGPGGAGSAPAAAGRAPSDMTEIGAASAVAGAAPTVAGAAPTTADTEATTAVGDAGAPAAAAWSEALSPARPRTRSRSRFAVLGRIGGLRKWRWQLLIAVLAAALVAAAVVGAVETGLFVPSVNSPSVVGDTLVAARTTLTASHLTVRVSSRHSSLTVPIGDVIRQIPPAGASIKQGSAVGVVLSTGPPPVPVPSLASVTGDCNQAASVLAAADLRTSCNHQSSTTVPAGSVISWSPKDHAPENSTVSVVVSSGPPSEAIPDLTGSTCAGATAALQGVGLKAQCANVYSATVPNGQVVNWSPTSQAPEGSTVTVNVSQGPPPVAVPDTYGDTLQQALTALQGAGLQAGSISGRGSGRVVQSSPPPGSMVPNGTSVNLVLQ